MDDWALMFGPGRGEWVDAYDPETGKLEHVQLTLPTILPPHMLRTARDSEVQFIKGRTKKQFYSLTFLGMPPLIVTAEVLAAHFGLHGYRSTPASPATKSRRRRAPVPVLANGHL